MPKLLGAHLSIPEACLFGHRYCWSLRGRIGHRWDLECCGIYKDNRVCIVRRSVSFQRQGFLSGKPSSEYNRTKLAVLQRRRRPSRDRQNARGVAELNQSVLPGLRSSTGIIPAARIARLQ